MGEVGHPDQDGFPVEGLLAAVGEVVEVSPEVVAALAEVEAAEAGRL